MSQGGGGQSLHSQTNMNDSMGTGLPPTSLMQSQMNNGETLSASNNCLCVCAVLIACLFLWATSLHHMYFLLFLHTLPYFSTACLALINTTCLFICDLWLVVFWWTECVLYPDCECVLSGPSHAPMQQQPTISMSLPPSSHGTGPGYSHSVPSSQGAPLQGQVAYSSMASRANLNMQSSQGEPRRELTWGSHPEKQCNRISYCGRRALRKMLFRNITHYSTTQVPNLCNAW